MNLKQKKQQYLKVKNMKKKFNFESEAHQKNHSVGIKIDKKPDKKKQAYAGLFDED